MEAKKVTTPREWGNQEYKNCYSAFFKMCRRDGNEITMNQLSMMVAHLGAEGAHKLCLLNGLPKEVHDIMLKVARHIEFKQEYE